MMHEFTFMGTPVCATYGLVLTEYEEKPPEPKTYIVDVPYGQDIDISDAVGGVAFHNRKHRIGLFFTGGTDQNDFEAKASEVYSALNGKRGDYSFSWDMWDDNGTPTPYTYTGRVTVSGMEFMGYGSGLITLDIDAQPYKVKERVQRTVTFMGSEQVTLQGGRKAVRPQITTDGPVFISYGPTTYLDAGTWTIRDLVVDGQEDVVLFAATDGTPATLYDYWADTLADLGADLLASLYIKAGTVTEDRTVTFEYEWSVL